MLRLCSGRLVKNLCGVSEDIDSPSAEGEGCERTSFRHLEFARAERRRRFPSATHDLAVVPSPFGQERVFGARPWKGAGVPPTRARGWPPPVLRPRRHGMPDRAHREVFPPYRPPFPEVRKHFRRKRPRSASTRAARHSSRAENSKASQTGRTARRASDSGDQPRREHLLTHFTRAVEGNGG